MLFVGAANLDASTDEKRTIDIGWLSYTENYLLFVVALVVCDVDANQLLGA